MFIPLLFVTSSFWNTLKLNVKMKAQECSHFTAIGGWLENVPLLLWLFQCYMLMHLVDAFI